MGRTINDMTPVSELPFNVRPKSRKEKNKLASRACRLKKKAQHEANKIKLYGLETEHSKCYSSKKSFLHSLISTTTIFNMFLLSQNGLLAELLTLRKRLPINLQGKQKTQKISINKLIKLQQLPQVCLKLLLHPSLSNAFIKLFRCSSF